MCKEWKNGKCLLSIRIRMNKNDIIFAQGEMVRGSWSRGKQGLGAFRLVKRRPTDRDLLRLPPLVPLYISLRLISSFLRCLARLLLMEQQQQAMTMMTSRRRRKEDMPLASSTSVLHSSASSSSSGSSGGPSGAGVTSSICQDPLLSSI